MIFPPRRMAPGERLTAANYNALLDYVRRITPIQGANITVDYRLGGSVISGTPGGAAEDEGVQPWTVRWHSDQWEIYLPDGCCNVGDSCENLNPAAAVTDGHESDGDAWRLLYVDEAGATTGTDSDGNSYVEFTVTAHAKLTAKVYGVDDLNAESRRLLFVGAQDALNDSPTDAEKYRDTPGDGWSCVVATIRITSVSEDGETTTKRTITQYRDAVADVSTDTGTQAFELVWYFSAEDGLLAVEKVYCVRQNLGLAGMSVTGDTMSEVTDASTVHAKIDTTDMSSGTGLVEVVADAEDTDVGTDVGTWLPLFEMTENTVTGDYRANSINNVQVYRA